MDNQRGGKQGRPSQFERNIVHPKVVFLDVRPSDMNPEEDVEYMAKLKAKQAYGHDPLLQEDITYENMKPVITIIRLMGGFPLHRNSAGLFTFKLISPAMFYSVVVFVLVCTHVGYVLLTRSHLKSSSADGKKNEGGRFEETVIEYLFVVYLLPIFMIPILWYETHKIAGTLNDWKTFEDLYHKVCTKPLPVALQRKGTLIGIFIPIISSLCSIIYHVTLVEFRVLQVIPYCFLTILTYILGGYWYLVCETIGQSAHYLSEEFHRALKNIGPSSYVADFRALWLRLSNLTRDTGISLCYTLVFLNLYLFLTITLSIYGLLSQIQEGFGFKDIGLFVTAASSIMLLFYLCDEAHYASQNVRVSFQKKLLTTELSWMNNDAQIEVNMFLKATDMNPTDISVAGFFDVNRGLFKSLLATMVTYLVVLLQFQISIPDDLSIENITFPAVPMSK